MNIQKLSKRFFAGLFILGLSFATSLLQASPLFDGKTADAWLIDSKTGQLKGYNLDKWVEQYSSADFPNIILGDNNAILVNSLPSSSLPMSLGQPSISLAGIGDSALSVGEESPDLKLAPAGGTFKKTIAIEMRVNTSLLSQGAYILNWKVGAKPQQSVGLDDQNTKNIQDGYYKKTIHLAVNGTYNVNVKLLTANGTIVESISETYKIEADANQLRRDTDGDGLPDIVELDIGLDPLSDDWDADLNGDGWKEVDTWLRKFCLNAVTKTPVAGDECLDADGLPIDTDNDNWSDFDEILRGTNPEDLEPAISQQQQGVNPTDLELEVIKRQSLRYKDYPSASRLYEVEYQIDRGSLQVPPSPDLKWTEADAVTINGKKLYDSNKLLDSSDLTQAGFTLGQVASRLTKSGVVASFASNKLPAMRVPASNSVVINAVHRYHPTGDDALDTTTADYERIYKVWLSRKADVTPKSMLDEVGEGTWTTADEWREAFIAYLLPRLTILRNPNINIESTLPVNVIEAVLTKESIFQGLSKIQLFVPSTLFGDLQFAKGWEKSLRRFEEVYTLDQSIIEIKNALRAGKNLASHTNWLQANFLAGRAGTRSDEYSVKQFLSEVDPAGLLRQYQFRLTALPNARTAIAGNTSSLELAVDTDSDGVNNNDEVNQPVSQLTLPWLSDSDGDSIIDGEDACTNDPLNNCSNNPVRPQLSLDLDFSVLEPTSDNGIVLVGVRLNQMANEPVTITYQTLVSASDTAIDGEDFTAVSGTVVIAAGKQTALIEIPILSDANDEEGNETFSFQITQVDNAVIVGDGIVVITLNDNTIVIPPLEAPLIENAVAQTYTKDVAITPLSFSNIGGGELILCTVDNLPVGLVIGTNTNATSCIINGTPTEIQATSLHTVTATNATGFDTATISIEVKQAATPLEAPELENLPLQTFTQGIEITPLRFVNNGGGEIIDCQPEVVPEGLSLSITDDKESCEYTGIPTRTQAATEHFLEAANNVGKSVATVYFEIIEADTPPTSFEIVDPTANAGNLFGAQVIILGNGNVVVNAPSDSSIAPNNGAVHLFDSNMQTLIGSVYGDNAGDRLGINGSFGSITVLSNNNYVITSRFDDIDGVVNAASVRLVSGETGEQIGTALTGDSTDDEFGASKIIGLENGNYVLLVFRDDVGGITDSGSVRLMNGTTGEQIGDVIVGETTGDFNLFSSVTALENNNYVVAAPQYTVNGISAGSVRLMNGATGIQIGSTLVGDNIADEIGSLITALPNSNYVVASSNDSVNSLDQAGSVRLMSGVDATQIGELLSGETQNDKIGSQVTALTNNNYVVVSPVVNVSGVPAAGSVQLMNGVTGAKVNKSIKADSATDFLGSGGITALSNNNFVIISPSDSNINGELGAGSIRLINGITGNQIGVEWGDNRDDQLGFSGVSALTNNNFVVRSERDVINGLSQAGSIRLISGITGKQIGNELIGDDRNDILGSNDITALENGNYVVAVPRENINGIKSIGSVNLIDGKTGLKIGNAIIGDVAFDLANAKITALANNNYVVILPVKDVNGVDQVGSVYLMDGVSGDQIGDTVLGNENGASTISRNLNSAFVVSSDDGSFYILAAPRWDNNGEVDAGLVRLIAP